VPLRALATSFINDYNDIIDSKGLAMASIMIRNLDDGLKSKLRVRAAQHGRSMEEEARHILRSALTEKAREPTNLYDAIRRRIEPLGGVDLDIPPRQPLRDPPRFDE
jgi:plasmid stability protein